MSAARIVKAVDVLMDRHLSLASCFPRKPPDQFSLDGFVEGLDGRIVVKIAFAAHRYLEAVSAQDFLTVVQTVLAVTCSPLRPLV